MFASWEEPDAKENGEGEKPKQDPQVKKDELKEELKEEIKEEEKEKAEDALADVKEEDNEEDWLLDMSCSHSQRKRKIFEWTPFCGF